MFLILMVFNNLNINQLSHTTDKIEEIFRDNERKTKGLLYL